MTDKLPQIQNMIYEVRGHKVMLDRELAALYKVEIKVLNQAVKRNLKRFPLEFKTLESIKIPCSVKA